MRIRNHTDDDYPLFCQWWEAWGWPCVPAIFLPKNSIVVVDDSDNPICAVFLYLTDTPIIWAENYISDKQSSLRGEALDMLIGNLNTVCGNLGASVVMSSVKHNVLARRLMKQGFARADDGLTNYVMVV